MSNQFAAPVVDLDAFATGAGGDPDLMAELAALFEAHGPRVFAECGAALAGHDLAGAHGVAMRLVEGLRSVKAREALGPARALRDACLANDPAGADAAWSRLTGAVRRLRPVLRVLAAA